MEIFAKGESLSNHPIAKSVLKNIIKKYHIMISKISKKYQGKE